MLDIFQQIQKQFIVTPWFEWLGTITGFLCVYLAAKQHIWNWPISIISVGAYAVLFYEAKLYGDTVLQLYFLATAIYGWYYWSKGKAHREKPIIKLSRRQMVLVFAIICLGTGIIGTFLKNVTDSDVPYIDGFCTAVSFTAQFLMTRKVLQNWLLWVFVDICYIPLYFHKNLFVTSILYFAFTIIAWNGYRAWLGIYRSVTSF